jgi:hypothetical protein
VCPPPVSIAAADCLGSTEERDAALDAVRAFVTAYPPDGVRAPAPAPPFASTRTVLVGARPLVRLTSAPQMPDDRVPPLLTFGDLRTLHARLAGAGDARAVAYVTWVCKAYEGALRRRREAALLPPDAVRKSRLVLVKPDGYL